jgi:hypothetical protein
MAGLAIPKVVNPQTIVLKCDNLSGKQYDESYADVAITPGMLLLRTATPGVRPDNVAGGTVGRERLVAVEKHFASDIPFATTFGTGGVTDVYAIGDHVRFHVAQPGELLWMLLPAAAAAIVEGDFLVSNGDGTLKKAAATDHRLFVAREAVDNSGGGGQVRIRAEALN